MREDVHFSKACNRLADAQHTLEDATLSAFTLFEARHATIAQALVNWIGDRRRASRWMMFQRNAFEGKSGYELVIEGNADTLWEHIVTMSVPYMDAYQVY